jgi:hypothetical protein
MFPLWAILTVVPISDMINEIHFQRFSTTQYTQSRWVDICSEVIDYVAIL